MIKSISNSGKGSINLNICQVTTMSCHTYSFKFIS